MFPLGAEHKKRPALGGPLAFVHFSANHHAYRRPPSETERHHQAWFALKEMDKGEFIGVCS